MTKRYKERWVCFDCRKMFRQMSQIGVAEADEPKRICPQCAQPMMNMGSFFAPPPTADINLWRVARVVAEQGFHCRKISASWLFWELAGRPNSTVPQIMARIAKHREGKGEELLAAIQKKGQAKKGK
ncbi:MAG: hypothetical protein JNM09_06555 [Blastocatellia bacterium]|nr:hypothetical protein [Blastocatellia bacterium]